MKKTNMLIAIVLTICLFSSVGGAVVVNLDASAIQELTDWAQQAKTLVQEWYPRVCNLLASKDFEPADTVSIVLRKSDRGIADTSGSRIRVYSGWIEKHPEDIGLVFHELVHVVQGYGAVGHSWLTEGIADYLRWAIYEGKSLDWFPVPDKPQGYRQSYRVCGGFLLWLESERSPGIVKKLNTALRNRQYSADMFKKEAGLGLDELWKTYVQEHKQAMAKTDPQSHDIIEIEKN